jgi:hypothetical protein
MRIARPTTMSIRLQNGVLRQNCSTGYWVSSTFRTSSNLDRGSPNEACHAKEYYLTTKTMLQHSAVQLGDKFELP